MKLLGMGTTPTNITTNSPALAVNTYPTYAKSFELQGRSYPINQLVPISTESSSGVFTNNGDGTWTINGTTESNVLKTIVSHFENSLTLGHTYFIGCNSGNANIYITDAYSATFPATGGQKIWTYSSEKSRTTIDIRVGAGTYSNITVTPQFIDLTQMFGAGFEPTTVDQLKAIIDLDKYIPHNPGTFIHNNATYEVNKWNQILSKTRYNPTTASSGITCTNNDDGTFTVTGTSTASISYTYMFASTSNPVVLDPAHKYIVPVADEAVEYTRLTLTTSSDTTGYSRCNVVITGYKALVQIWNRVAQDVSVNYTTSFSVIDLTDIFGAGKEPSTVDECKLRFLAMGIDITKYQPYSPLGSNLGGNTFNLWDGTCIDGQAIGNTGGTYASSSNFVTYYIAVRPSTLYYLNAANWENWVGEYDADRVWIRNQSTGDGTILTRSNCAYLRLTGKISQKATACFNINQPNTSISPHNGDYEPYKPQIDKVDLGFNIWDEEWTNGYINLTTGEIVSDNTYICSKNYIPVIAGQSYYFNCQYNGGVAYYKADKSFISRVVVNTNSVFVPPELAAFIRFNPYLQYGAIYNHDICINLSQPDTTKSPHNGDYRPYLMLRGIGNDFNVWDEEVESGYIDSSGIPQNHSTSLRSKNYCQCVGGCVYYGMQPTSYGNATAIAWYNSNKTFLSRGTVYNATITAPTDAVFFKVSLYNYGTTYKNDICINLSQPQTTINPHNGQYVPHLFDTYDSISGILTRRIKQVTFTGSGDGAKVGSSMTAWEDTYGTTNSYGIRVFSLNYCDSKNGGAVLSGFGESYRDRNSQLSQEGMGVNTSGNTIFIAILASRLSTVSSTGFATWLQSNPLTLLYELNAYQVFIPTSKVGIVDMGSLNWTRVDVTGSGGYVFSTPATPLQMYKQSDNLWCSGYTTGHYTGTGSTIYNYGNKTIAQHTPSGEFNIYVRDDSYTSASDFKNAVKGMILTYELSDSISQTTIIQPISFVSGKLGKKYGVVDLGSLSWAYSSSRFNYNYVLPGSAIPTSNTTPFDGYCARYIIDAANYGVNGEIVMNNQGYLRIYDNKFTNATAFKNSLQGQYLIYKLADNATNPTYATAGNLIQKTKGDVGDVDFNLNYWEESQVKLIKVGNKFLAVSE